MIMLHACLLLDMRFCLPLAFNNLLKYIEVGKKNMDLGLLLHCPVRANSMFGITFDLAAGANVLLCTRLAARPLILGS